jgi:hypothetical protein
VNKYIKMKLAFTLLSLLAVAPNGADAFAAGSPGTRYVEVPDAFGKVFYDDCEVLLAPPPAFDFIAAAEFCEANDDCSHFLLDPSGFYPLDCSQSLGSRAYDDDIIGFYRKAADPNLSGLFETWFLAERAFDFSSDQFDMTYRFSGAMTDLQTRYKLYLSNEDENLACIDEYEGQALTGTLDGIVPNGEYSDIFMMAQQETLNVTIDGEKMATDPTFNETEATVKFCVRYSLYTDPEKAGGVDEEINYLETMVTLTIDFTAGFDAFKVTGIKVEPLELLKDEASQAFELEAFQCTGKPDAVTPAVEAPQGEAFNQGDAIRICIQPNEEARDLDIYMKRIETLTYYLQEEAPKTGFVAGVEQKAIDINDNTASSTAKGEMYGLTNIDDCMGERTCVIDTILFATFFTRDGFVTGLGRGVMQFGTDKERRRMLRDNSFGDNGRQLQEAFRPKKVDGEAVGESEFNMNFQIAADNSFEAAAGVGSITTFFALAVGSIGAAALLL